LPLSEAALVARAAGAVPIAMYATVC